MKELRKREAELGIEPDRDIDAFMTADTAQGKRENLVSELTMHLLGLDASPLFCALIFASGSPILIIAFLCLYPSFNLLIPDILFVLFLLFILLLV